MIKLNEGKLFKKNFFHTDYVLYNHNWCRTSRITLITKKFKSLLE